MFFVLSVFLFVNCLSSEVTLEPLFARDIFFIESMLDLHQPYLGFSIKHTHVAMPFCFLKETVAPDDVIGSKKTEVLGDGVTVTMKFDPSKFINASRYQNLIAIFTLDKKRKVTSKVSLEFSKLNKDDAIQYMTSKSIISGWFGRLQNWLGLL